MASAFVQSAQGTWTSGTTFSATLTATTGNLLAVWLAIDGTTTGLTVVSIGDGGNTFTPIDLHYDGDGGVDHYSQTYYAANITGGTRTVVVTLNAPLVDAGAIIIHEVSGAATTLALDRHALATQSVPGSGTDALTSGEVSTVVAGEYIFGGYHEHFYADGFSMGTGFTAMQTVGRFGAEYRVQASPGAIAATFTAGYGGPGRFFATAIATFRPVGGPFPDPSIPVLDSGLRASGAIGTNWAHWPVYSYANDLRIAANSFNATQGITANGIGSMDYWTPTPTYTGRVQTAIKYSTVPQSGESIFLALHSGNPQSATLYSGYLLKYAMSSAIQGQITLYRFDNGTPTTLIPAGDGGLPTVNDLIGLEYNAGRLNVYLNTTIIATYGPESTYTSGALALGIESGTPFVNNFYGGTVGGPGFPTTSLIDTTTRANEPVLSNGGVWTGVVNTQLLSNQIKAVTNTTFYALTAAQTSSANCEMYCTLAAHPATGNLWQLYVRHNAAASNNYTLNLVNYAGANTYTTVTLAKTVAGTTTTLATLGSTVVAPGAQVGLLVTGNVLTGFLNGASFITATDSANSIPAAGQLVFLGQDTTLALTQVGGGPMGGPPADTGLRTRAMHHYATQRS